ncbi:MAG: hypothetical protein QG646_3341, partial [Euryarchaeota archaeon]|nr:hypothetical protein [Euryarchaeota archaeon]
NYIKSIARMTFMTLTDDQCIPPTMRSIVMRSIAMRSIAMRSIAMRSIIMKFVFDILFPRNK